MRVTVATGSRLHLGFTNLSEDLGRCFGSLGVAIDRPSTTVIVEDGGRLETAGDDAERVRTWRRRFCEHYGVDPQVSLEVREPDPVHVGWARARSSRWPWGSRLPPPVASTPRPQSSRR
jgi:beta-ribofuranosylaminobenzene 5'-phosphate synthase